MPYVENRIVHDADSHIMELPDMLDEFLEQKYLACYEALPKLTREIRRGEFARSVRAKQDDQDFRAEALRRVCETLMMPSFPAVTYESVQTQ